MRKTKYIVILILVIFISFSENVLALSDDFIYMIETVGIPRYNVYKEEINEIVYETYNVFVYSGPLELESQDVGQRFSSSKYGLWTKGGSKYVGNGIQGEYELLGRDYSGNLIYNYQFIMDSVPTTSPEKWHYIETSDAASSWQNTHILTRQVEYMKQAKWIFADITDPLNVDNPNNQIEYDLNAITVGLNKARLEVPATWKTKGSIFVRHESNGGIWYATFAVAPMSASANVKSYIACEDKYILMEDKEELKIPISYGANVTGLTKYASINDIHTLYSNITINGEKVGETSGSKITQVGNTYMLVINRKKFSPNRTHQINIRNDSYIQTAFAMDGLIQNKESKTIFVRVDNIKKESIEQMSVMQLVKENDVAVVSPLAQIYYQKDLVGVTEAGKHIVAKCYLSQTFDVQKLLDNKNAVITYIDGRAVSIGYDSLINNILCIDIMLPLDMSTTLYGITSLRENIGSYYDLDISKIGKRVRQPHLVTIKIGKEQAEFKIDTVDSYIKNINSNINAEKNDYAVLYDEWKAF